VRGKVEMSKEDFIKDSLERVKQLDKEYWELDEKIWRLI